MTLEQVETYLNQNIGRITHLAINHGDPDAIKAAALVMNYPIDPTRYEQELIEAVITLQQKEGKHEAQ